MRRVRVALSFAWDRPNIERASLAPFGGLSNGEIPAAMPECFFARSRGIGGGYGGPADRRDVEDRLAASAELGRKAP